MIGIGPLLARKTPLGIRAGMYGGSGLISVLAGLKGSGLLNQSQDSMTGYVYDIGTGDAIPLVGFLLLFCLRYYEVPCHMTIGPVLISGGLLLSGEAPMPQAYVAMPDVSQLTDSPSAVLSTLMEVVGFALLPRIVGIVWAMLLTVDNSPSDGVLAASSLLSSSMGAISMSPMTEPEPLWITSEYNPPTCVSGIWSALLLSSSVFLLPMLSSVPERAVAPLLMLGGIHNALKIESIITNNEGRPAQSGDVLVAFVAISVMILTGSIPIGLYMALGTHYLLSTLRSLPYWCEDASVDEVSDSLLCNNDTAPREEAEVLPCLSGDLAEPLTGENSCQGEEELERDLEAALEEGGPGEGRREGRLIDSTSSAGSFIHDVESRSGVGVTRLASRRQDQIRSILRQEH